MIRRLVIAVIAAVALGGAALAGYLILGPGACRLCVRQEGCPRAVRWGRSHGRTGRNEDCDSSDSRGVPDSSRRLCGVPHRPQWDSFRRRPRVRAAVWHPVFDQYHPGCPDGNWPVFRSSISGCRASRIRADGAALYPAMPYPSYTYMSDADALAIKPIYSRSRRNVPRHPGTGFSFRSTSACSCEYGRRCSTAIIVLSPMPIRALSGTAALIWWKRWSTAPSAIRRAILPSR